MEARLPSSTKYPFVDLMMESINIVHRGGGFSLEPVYLGDAYAAHDFGHSQSRNIFEFPVHVLGSALWVRPGSLIL